MQGLRESEAFLTGNQKQKGDSILTGRQITVDEFKTKFSGDFQRIEEFYSIYYSYVNNFRHPYIERDEENSNFEIVLLDDEAFNVVQIALDNFKKEISLGLDSKWQSFSFKDKDQAVRILKDHMEEMKCYS